MEKLKLLFIMDTFPLGGIAKSLLALFNELQDRYEIDLLLMKQEGLFLQLIPDNVNLLPEPIRPEFRDPHPKRIIQNYKIMNTSQWLSWIGYSVKCSIGRLTGGLHRHIQVMDKWLGKHIPALNKHYDAAIAYQGGRCIYYLVENVDSSVKIGYVHSDYSNNETDFMLKKTDKEYFPQLDYVVTISLECQISLKKEFPEIAEKFEVVENICSPDYIKNLALSGESFSDNFEGHRIVTMGRFDINTKGFDLALDACRILIDKGYLVRWYVLGDGVQRPILESMIRDRKLTNDFILLGAKINPYTYIKDADIYVHPSRIEGKSVALDEVKALAKPTVVTDFSTVYDQFADNKTALICKMEAVDIAEKISYLIDDCDLCSKLSQNLKREKVGNKEQADVFISLIHKKHQSR